MPVEITVAIVSGIALTASGAFGKAAVDVFAAGRRRKRIAKGEIESRLDRALRSRAVWIDDALYHRGIVYQASQGGARPMPADPWTDPPPETTT